MKTNRICGLLAALLLTASLPVTSLAVGPEEETARPENVVIAPDPTIPPNPTIAPRPLADLPESHWAYEAAARLMGLGAMAPVDRDAFAPEEPFTREMFVSALWNLSGRPVVNAILTFRDVEQGTDAAEAVRWAAAQGIVSGYDAGTFGPRDPMTREQLAKMMYAYVQQYGMGFRGAWMFLLPQKDADQISPWAFEPMHWVVASRILQGVTPELLAPQGRVTRAQGAVMLSRLLDTAEREGVDFRNFEGRETSGETAAEA